MNHRSRDRNAPFSTTLNDADENSLSFLIREDRTMYEEGLMLVGLGRDVDSDQCALILRWHQVDLNP